MPKSTKSLEQIEQERMTRRQALGKFGFGAGLSAFMLLGVDDLARTVGAKMQQMAGDNQVAEQIAKEFQNVGVAFASPSNPSGPNPGCQACVNDKNTNATACDSILASCYSGCVPDPAACVTGYALCLEGKISEYAKCCRDHNCNC